MAYPDRLSATVTIGSVDVTDLIDPQKGVTIQNVLTRKADTCSFKLDRTSGVSPSAWQEIVVLDGATRIFAGYSQDIDEDEGADLLLDHKISATDYSIRLEKVIVKKQYENMTDRAILADLFATYLTGEGFNVSTHVSTIKTHTRIRFNRITLLDCIKVLADLASADYYVDYDKYLWFFKTDTGASTAPFALSDSPDLTTSMPYSDFSLNRDGSGVVNRVEVIGGNYRSDDTTFYLPGTGQEKKIILPFKLHAPDGETGILVYRNDGTLGVPVWTQLDVLAGYLQQLTTSTEVLYYFNEKVIEQQDPFPNLANAVKIVAKYEVPLRTRVSDDVSIAHYGLTLDGLIVDSQITDKPTARIAALAKLAASSMETVAITLTTYQPGLQAGQIVTVVNTIHGINSSYLVQKVMTKIGIAGAAKYSITLGTYNPSLIDLILTLSRQAKPKIEWRDDEVLDELLQRDESLSFVEVVNDATTTAPYYFTSDASYDFDWGFGSFDNIPYVLNDEFTTDRAAGAVNGTSAEPTGGVRTVADTNNKISITGSVLSIATGHVAGNGIWIPFTAARTVGKTLFVSVTPANTSQNFEIGFDSDTTVTIGDNISFQTSGSINARPSGASMPCGTYAGATTYRIAIVLRSTGTFYFIKGGAFLTWTLLMPATNGTAVPGYAAIASRITTSILTADNIRIPERLFTNVIPLQSDGFSASTTDGLGNVENNGVAGNAYTNVGTWGVSAGKRTCSVLSGGLGFSYLACTSSDVIIDATCTRTAGVTGVVARYADASNYLIAYHDGTNCKLDKVVAGVTTNLVSAVATYSATAVLRLVLEGTTARLFYNNAAVGAVATTPTAGSLNHGLYTTNINATFDNLVIWARGTEGQYEEFEQYTE